MTVDTGRSTIYLEQQRYAVEKMSNIKKEELTWLKLYLVYLGVLSSGVVKLIIDLPKERKNIDYVLSNIETFFIVVFISFCIFLILMLYLRFLYFLQKLNSMNWEVKLNLLEKNSFELEAKDWWKFTSPAKGFLFNSLVITSTSLMFSFAIKKLVLINFKPFYLIESSWWTDLIFLSLIYFLALLLLFSVDFLLYRVFLIKQALKFKRDK
jgi:hypothetical protein